MRSLKILIASGLLATGIGTAQANQQGDALLGSGLGGAGGAWIGSQFFGGQGGAILGGGLGALAGTFLATNHDYDDDRDKNNGRRYEPRRDHDWTHNRHRYWRR